MKSGDHGKLNVYTFVRNVPLALELISMVENKNESHAIEIYDKMKDSAQKKVIGHHNNKQFKTLTPADIFRYEVFEPAMNQLRPWLMFTINKFERFCCDKSNFVKDYALRVSKSWSCSWIWLFVFFCFFFCNSWISWISGNSCNSWILLNFVFFLFSSHNHI